MINDFSDDEEITHDALSPQQQWAYREQRHAEAIRVETHRCRVSIAVLIGIVVVQTAGTCTPAFLVVNEPVPTKIVAAAIAVAWYFSMCVVLKRATARLRDWTYSVEGLS